MGLEDIGEWVDVLFIGWFGWLGLSTTSLNIHFYVPSQIDLLSRLSINP